MRDSWLRGKTNLNSLHWSYKIFMQQYFTILFCKHDLKFTVDQSDKLGTLDSQISS